jgi:catechol 2,3-dioxygenase-like lactoylglutathione lyase family enzyme
LVVVAAGSAWSNEPRPEPKIEYRGTLLVQLRVSNLEKAIEFYTSILNFELVKRNDSLHWAELSFGIPGVLVGLGEGEEVRGSGTASLNIGVQNVDRARTVLEHRGVTFLRPTLEIPGKVKLADFVDPDGNKIRLAETIRS